MLKLNLGSALCGALLAGLCSCSALAENADDLFPDPVVARGTGFQIKRSKLQESFVLLKASMAARGKPVLEIDRPTYESNLLQRIIITEILTRKATAEEKEKAKADTLKYIEKAKQQYNDLFDAEVKASGMSLPDFTQRATEQNLCELVLERELKTGIEIKDEEVKKYYENHPEDFEDPEQVRASHILISTSDPATGAPLPAGQKAAKEKLVRELKARAEKGEDFALLAKEFSEDPASKNKGGEYTFGRGRMVKEFEAAAFSLRTNQVSDVVETRYGYHIIKLLEKIPAKKVSLADATPQIKKYLTDVEFQNRIPDYLKKVKAEAKVELIDPKGQSAAAQPTGSTPSAK